jgi:hypothetical protein
MYPGPALDRNKVVVVSTVWGSATQQVSSRVTFIDDKPFESTNHREIHLLQGHHRLEVEIKADLSSSISVGTITTRGKRALVSVEQDFQAGHTYVLRVERQAGDAFRLVVADLGLDFPERCMPLTLFRAGKGMDAPCDPKS